jgi:hypothetical protein
MCSSSVSLLLICSPAAVATTLKVVRASLEEVDVHSMWPSGGDDSASTSTSTLTSTSTSTLAHCLASEGRGGIAKYPQ